jgi:hypothetical protein
MIQERWEMALGMGRLVTLKYTPFYTLGSRASVGGNFYYTWAILTSGNVYTAAINIFLKRILWDFTSFSDFRSFTTDKNIFLHI